MDQAPWGAVVSASAMPKATPNADPPPQSTSVAGVVAPPKRDCPANSQSAGKRARLMPVNSVTTVDDKWRVPDATGLDDVYCILKVLCQLKYSHPMCTSVRMCLVQCHVCVCA